MRMNQRFVLALVLSFAFFTSVFSQATAPADVFSQAEFDNMVKANNAIRISYLDTDGIDETVDNWFYFNKEGDRFVVDVSNNPFALNVDLADYSKRTIRMEYLGETFELIFGRVNSARSVIGKKNGVDYCHGSEGVGVTMFGLLKVREHKMPDCGVSFFYDYVTAGTTDIHINKFSFDESFLMGPIKNTYREFKGKRGIFEPEKIADVAEQFYHKIVVTYHGTDWTDDTAFRNYDVVRMMDNGTPFFHVFMKTPSGSDDVMDFDHDNEKQNNFSIDYLSLRYKIVITEGTHGQKFWVAKNDAPCGSFDVGSFEDPVWLSGKSEIWNQCGIDLRVWNAGVFNPGVDLRVQGIRFSEKTVLEAASKTLAGRNPAKVAQLVGSLRELTNQFNYVDIFDPVFQGDKLTKFYTGDYIFLEQQGDGNPKDRFFLITANKKILYVLYAYEDNDTGYFVDSAALGLRKPTEALFIDKINMADFERKFAGMPETSREEISSFDIANGGVGFQRQPDALQKKFLINNPTTLSELGLEGLRVGADWVVPPVMVASGGIAVASAFRDVGTGGLGTVLPNMGADAAAGGRLILQTGQSAVTTPASAVWNLRLGRDVRVADRFMAEATALSNFHPAGTNEPAIQRLFELGSRAQQEAQYARTIAQTPPAITGRTARSVLRARSLGQASQALTETIDASRVYAEAFLRNENFARFSPEVSQNLRTLYEASPSFRRGVERAISANPSQYSALAEHLQTSARLRRTAQIAEEAARLGSYASRVRRGERLLHAGSQIRRAASALWRLPAATLVGIRGLLIPAGPVGWAVFIVATGVDVGMTIYHYTGTATSAFDSFQVVSNWDPEAWTSADVKVNYLFLNLKEDQYADLAKDLEHFSFVTVNPNDIAYLSVFLEDHGTYCDLKYFYSCLLEKKVLSIQKVDQTGSPLPNQTGVFEVNQLVGADNIAVGEILVLNKVVPNDAFLLTLDLSSMGGEKLDAVPLVVGDSDEEADDIPLFTEVLG